MFSMNKSDLKKIDKLFEELRQSLNSCYSIFVQISIIIFLLTK